MALTTLLSRRWSLLWTLPALYALSLLLSIALSLRTTPPVQLTPQLLRAFYLISSSASTGALGPSSAGSIGAPRTARRWPVPGAYRPTVRR